MTRTSRLHSHIEEETKCFIAGSDKQANTKISFLHKITFYSVKFDNGKIMYGYGHSLGTLIDYMEYTFYIYGLTILFSAPRPTYINKKYFHSFDSLGIL